MELDTALEAVSDAKSFLIFTRLLAKDRAVSVAKETANPTNPYGPDANGWENTSIEQFLEAATNWGESTDMGLTQRLAPENLWKRFAVFLYCGKIYE